MGVRQHYEQTLDTFRDDPTRLELARLLATAADPSVRNGPRSVKLCQAGATAGAGGGVTGAFRSTASTPANAAYFSLIWFSVSETAPA